jgi:hypothetical protein
VRGEVAHHRHRDAITGDVVGLIVSGRQFVIFRQAHQTSRFARRNKPRSNCFAFDNQELLARGPTRRRSETTGDVVKAHLRSSGAATIRVWASASVDGAHHAPARSFGLPDLLAVHRRHAVEQFLGLPSLVPGNPVGAVLEKVR